MMRLAPFVAAAILGLTLVTGACASPKTTNPPSAKSAQIKISIIDDYDEQWRPSVVTISAGGTVAWTNNGHLLHSIISDQGVWPNWKLSPGETYSFTFTKTGNFTYHDETDVYTNTIEVQ